MMRLPQGICICNDCMQKTFDSMTGLPNMGMPYMDMFNMAQPPQYEDIPERQKLKKKKPKEKKKLQREKRFLIFSICRHRM